MEPVIQFTNFTNKELDYLAEQIAQRMKRKSKLISQREAYRLFGEGNVDRWDQEGKTIRYRRPKKWEYEAERLCELAAQKQDYHKMTV